MRAQPKPSPHTSDGEPVRLARTYGRLPRVPALSSRLLAARWSPSPNVIAPGRHERAAKRKGHAPAAVGQLAAKGRPCGRLLLEDPELVKARHPILGVPSANDFPVFDLMNVDDLNAHSPVL